MTLNPLLHLVAFWLCIVTPILGPIQQKRFMASTDPRRKEKRYVFTIVRSWVLTVAILCTIPWTPLTRIIGNEEFPTRTLGYAAFMGFGLVLLTLLAPLILMHRSKVYAERVVIAMSRISWLLPESPSECSLFAGVSLTAGFCEEVLFRYFLCAYFVVLFGVSYYPAIILSALFFGLAHSYQGIRGILLTGVLGFAFSSLFSLTGTLWVPIVIHVCFDLRLILLWSKARAVMGKQAESELPKTTTLE